MSNESKAEAKAKADRLQNKVHMFWEFPKGCADADGNPLESLVVREVDTIDMRDAGRTADANNTEFAAELMAIAVVAINGRPLHGPAQTEGWNAKASEWLARCYNRLNHLSPAELEQLGKGRAVNPKTMTPAEKPAAG